MSYQSWHEYGYGICIDDIETTADKVLELVHLAPEFENKFVKWIESYKEYENVENIDMDDIYEGYEDEYCCELGLGPIIRAVINECENIELLCCSNYNGEQYLIFNVTYPWYMSDKEKNMTEEDVRLVISKYVNMLTDKNIIIEYQSVENGG